MRCKPKNRPIPDDVVNDEATAQLESPYFFRDLLRALERNGLVGEERNALAVYSAATSRLLNTPMCLLVKGPSGIGKNFLGDTVFDFFPPSEIRTISSSSLRAWNYQRTKLAHKCVYLKERNETAGPVHPARLLISEKELRHSVTVKKGGRFVQKTVITKGPIAAISTTTKDKVEIDDETRHVSIWLDDSPKQTRRIMDAALVERNPLSKREIAVWHQVQRLLKRRAKSSIEFPDWFRELAGLVSEERMVARRYFQAFLQACKVVALIGSFRSSGRRPSSEQKITVRFIDLAVATLIFNTAFTESIGKTERGHLDARRTARTIAAMSERKRGAAVGATELAREMDISMDRAYAMLRRAAIAGLIRRANRPARANLKTYLPSEKSQFLPEPERVYRTLAGLPNKVKFAHPLTGKWVIYRR